MGTEIERKFLVKGDAWRVGAHASRIRQGYLCVGPPVAIRVRISDGQATLNVKKATLATVRDEFEYAIPAEDAQAMLDGLCDGFPIDKTRHRAVYEGMTWEVDEFHGENAGLVVAEIELEAVDQAFARPDWLGEEVSDDARFFNSSLSRCPYAHWREDARQRRKT